MQQQHFQYLLNKVIHGTADSDQHLLTFMSLALNIKAKKILELGVRDGNSTVPFILAAAELGGYVESVDLEKTRWQCPEDLQQYWTFTESDAIKYLEDCVQQNKQYDLIYIDDWHAYAHVKRELELVEHLVTPSSIILIHDTMYSNTQPDYHMEVDTTDDQWAGGGPYRAVAELDPAVWEWATIPANHGMTLLRKKSKTIRTS